MLQLRLWLTVVVLVVTGLLVLLLGTSALYERVMSPFETLSGQVVNALDGALVKQGAEAVEAATKASVDDAVRTAVKKGELGPEAEAALLGRAGTQGAPAFALIVKPDGTIAAHAGTAIKLEGPLTGLPYFAEAATGVARDGIHVVDGKPWHLASAPVYDSATLDGVIILGWPFDAAFADRLSQQMSTPVLLLVKGDRVGDGLKSLTNEQLRIRGQGAGDLDLAPLPTFLPLLMEHGRFSLTSRPLTFGDESVSAVIGVDRNEAFRALAWAQALVLIGTVLITLLQVVLVFSTLRGVSKPIAVIVDHLSQVSQGNTVGILPEAALSGQFLRLGKQVNMILQMMPSASRPGAPLGAIGNTQAQAAPTPSLSPNLGPNLGMGGGLAFGKEPSGATPAAPGGDSAFGLADFSSASPRPSTPPQADPPSGLSGLFDDGHSAPDPLAAFRVAPKPSTPPTPARQPEPEPEAPEMNEPALPSGSGMSPEATVMFSVPPELLQESAQSQPARPAAPPPAAQRMMTDDARTVVAQVPQELLSAAAPRDNINNADEQHYKEVYDKFVETRVQCGEDTSDLTYDRFVAKLMKNRQQIVEKHKAKSVRFQVYVKEGKAALRALPVRE